MKKQKNNRMTMQKREWMVCYLILLPSIIGFLVFDLYPILWAGTISFYNYDLNDIYTNFVGWNNYINVFRDEKFWSSWGNNLKFMLIKTPIEAVLAFITANLLIDKTRFAGVFRAVYFLPAVLSTAIVSLIFSNMFDYFGVFNTYLVKGGIIEKNINWLESEHTAFIMGFVATLWMSFGTNVLYYQSALSTVPKEVIESAQIDGANAFVTTFKVKLPMILPTMQVLLLLSMRGCLGLGEIILLLTNGFPAGKSYTISAYLMSRIVPGMGQQANLGYAAAMSLVVSLVCCLCALGFNKLTKKLKTIY